ncbi:MAG: hypothetical protein AB1489_00530 [Acidobacteriota bacterium]
MSEMQTAYQLAALAVRERFAEQHPEDLAVLDRIESGDVAAYSGSFDQAEEALRCLGIPTTINPQANSLTAKIVFINCSSSYDTKLIEEIGRYVEAGKWLVTSDWALHYIIERVFPDTVRWTRQSTGDEVISVEPNLDSFWSETVVLGADPQWWLWGSYPIEVLNREKVSIEAASHNLLVRYNAPVVAVRFDWGKGQVFHVISHFWAKRSGTPTVRHTGPCTDFLKVGMRLSDKGIEKVLNEAKIEPSSVNFAMIQSAATAMELIAQLCVRAMRSS